MICFVGCIRDDYSSCPDNGIRVVRLCFSTRQMQATRANPHTEHTAAESCIHNLQIWVFSNGASLDAIAYEELPEDRINALTDRYGNISVVLEIPEKNMGASGKLDFYIAANAAAAGITLNEGMRRNELEAVSFNSFPPSPTVSSVPPEGLPISRIVRGAQVGEQDIRIPLVRAVSKLRFFLAAPSGLSGANILSLELKGDAIAESVYFFPRPVNWNPDLGSPEEANIVAASGYHTDGVGIVPSASDLHYTDDPAIFAPGSTEDIQQWLDRMDGAGFLHCGLTYLKETDRQLRGVIRYTMEATGDRIRSAEFSLNAGKFVRNHEWIVYAYFDRDRLFVHPVIADWDDGGTFDFTWSYTNTFTNMTGMESTKVMEEGGTSYVMAAYGRAPSGLPYSPKLGLTVASSETTVATMRLQTDNPDFGFIIDEGGVLSPVNDYIDMNLSPESKTVIFYFVPKFQFDLAGSNPAESVARVYLYLLGSNLSSFRIPFNTIDMPGTHEYLRFHYVTADLFR